MNRREFLKSSGSMVALAQLGRPAEAVNVASHTAGKRVLSLNRGWRFSPHVPTGVHSPSFNDASFEPVVLPHTNRRLPWHGFSDKSYQFVSVYRRELKVPSYALGKRVFVDFEGVMTSSTVWLNGMRLGEYKGGYTPFSFELTGHLHAGGKNVLVVEVDSTERPDIPPFGAEIDYLTFGGIYREVSLRIVSHVFLENIRVRSLKVLTSAPELEVECFLDHAPDGTEEGYELQVQLKDGDRVLATGQGIPASATEGHQDSQGVQGDAITSMKEARTLVRLAGLGSIRLWELSDPKLYEVHVSLMHKGRVLDQDSRRIGFREAVFTDKGFSLNGRILKLHGLNRHQTFPYVGGAMPVRVQRRDADILRYDLRCNIVRTSHYPQSRHFLDRCDEIGLLVLEEIPGWNHMGDIAWQDIAVDNVRRMIRRDWNHPSVILWGVRINESNDNHAFYIRTNAAAHALDDARQTGGIRNRFDSELLEDVFTMNDFGWPLQKPNHPHYLNTEFVGHTFSTKTIDGLDRLREHTIRHARVHDQLASDPRYAGGMGWCAFDYNTHNKFGSGDRICYHGVMDIFRTPKPAAGFYKSMCHPSEEIVLEPAFHWARGDESTRFSVALISSNCDHLKLFMDSGTGYELIGEGDPDRAQFPHLPYPPFSIDISSHMMAWGNLRIDGYIEGKVVISKNYSGDGVDEQFELFADDHTLIANGADTTRLVLRVNDRFGRVRPFATGAIHLEVEGPAELIGDNPFPLVGGTGAVWVRSREMAATLRVHAIHPQLGTRTIQLALLASEPEEA